MLDADKVLEMFALFGDLDGEQLEQWAPLCRRGAGRITQRLREDVDPAAEMEPLCIAAAALAYADYVLLQSTAAGGSGEDVQVGDIRLKSRDAGGVGGDALEIAEHFLAGVAHLLRPDCPALLCVEEPE